MADARGTHRRFDLQIAYDDGAGYGKWHATLLRPTATHAAGAVTTLKIMALAALHERDTYELADDEPILIEEPNYGGTGPIFEHAVVYAIGDTVLRKGSAGFDTTNGRYTSEGARLRFHGGLSRILRHFGLTEATVHLTIGINTERYRDLKTLVEQFYAADHYFRGNGTEYRVHVGQVLSAPQAWAAAKHIRVEPPESLATMLAQYPIEESTTMVLDGGNFSLDATVLEPHETRAGVLVPQIMFAVTVGVHEIRQQLEEYLTSRLGQRPALRTVERAMNPEPRNARFFGTVPDQTTGGVVDITPQLQAIRRSVWENAWTQVRSRTRGIAARYIVVVGGMGIVCAQEIAQTELAQVHPSEDRSLRLSDLPGFVNMLSEWTVVEGLALLGAEDVASIA